MMTYTAHNYPPPPAVTPFDRALVTAPFSAGGRTNLPALPPTGPLSRQIATAEYNELCRAALTSTALENCAALSAMEAHLNMVAPYGCMRYKAIVDAYAIGAINAIARR